MSLIRLARPTLFCLFLCACIYANGQLNVSFSPDQSAGCAPFAIKFTNTTSGLSSAAQFRWDLGNGNQSVLKDAAAIYYQPGNYTVSLTVTDGNKTGKFSTTIVVAEAPVVDFSLSTAKGCFPLRVTLSSSSEAGTGSITEYLWDFGDGHTQTSYQPSVEHLYEQRQNPEISLTVTNNYGCQSTLRLRDRLVVLDELRPAFQLDQKVLCTIREAGQFINSSTGPGNLSYEWDFGDGTGSQQASPSHVYANKGTYSIKLTAKSSEGCVQTLLKEQALNVANYKADWQPDATVCEGVFVNLQNKSFPVPDASTWHFGDGISYGGYASDMPYLYQHAGTYKVQLVSTFGSCQDSLEKDLIVRPVPNLQGFLIDTPGVCGGPMLTTLTDTTSDAVRWEWSENYWGDILSDKKIFKYQIQNAGSSLRQIYLRVFNQFGCTNLVVKPLIVTAPAISVQAFDKDGNPAKLASCGPAELHFKAQADVPIASYKWDFGDGTTSTLANPVHLYSREGSFNVTLRYTSTTGCTGVAGLNGRVVISFNRKRDFSFSSTNICGNTPVLISAPSEQGYSYSWDFGDGNTGYLSSGQLSYKYQQEGVFTVKLIMTNYVCSDTVIKSNYVKVSRPFPTILNVMNTCEGTRGEVTFTQADAKATGWSWNFGDGQTYNSSVHEDQVVHKYTRSGTYRIVLTTTNGQCKVSDSTIAYVLLKQKPVLSADKLLVCNQNDNLTVSYSNMEPNPLGNSVYNYSYSTIMGVSGDGLGNYGQHGTENASYSVPVSRAQTGDDGFYAIVTSDYFYCSDTTNIIPLKVRGPNAGFEQVLLDPCSDPGNTIKLRDSSKGYNNAAIVSWLWEFQDGSTSAQGPTVTHSYQQGFNPYYPVMMRVKDADGCSAQFYKQVYITNPYLEAIISATATQISPGSSVQFYNSSRTHQPSNTSYKWLLPDGSQSTLNNVDYHFSEPGTYKVLLVAHNSSTGCSDTASTAVTVRFVNAAFRINQSFVSNRNCPPVLVQFTNNSYNISKIQWDFGDGTVIENVYNPSHIYTSAGTYYVKLTTESDNGTKYVTLDSLHIGSVSTSLSADKLKGCTAQTISLSASGKGSKNYLWDFGDGIVQAGVDTFSVHHYSAAGIYEPKLIAIDSFGCPVSSDLGNKIIIDSLAVNLAELPDRICSPKQLLMNPDIVSIGAGQSGSALNYHWNFGTGNPADTSAERNPVFSFLNPVSHTISLTVSSDFGCRKTVVKTMAVNQGLGAIIEGPPTVCAGGAVQFSGKTRIPGTALYRWIFDDGSSSQQQQTAPKVFQAAGDHPVTLVVDNQNCLDTVTQLLRVLPLPNIVLSLQEAKLCEGSSLNITASGASTYAWTPATGLNTVSSNAIIARPIEDQVYTVKGTSAEGCENTTQVSIDVIHPFQLVLSGNASLCLGESVQLQASGADHYQWISNTNGLSSTTIANPLAKPSESTQYTVKGSDKENCFSSQQSVMVTVNKLPTIEAGPDAEIFGGTTYTLNAVASPDVIAWNWSPADYLSCSNCPSPVSSPLNSTTYEVTVTNNAGCQAKDQVTVKMLCDASKVFVPTAFTPNGDGKNERFNIQAAGIQLMNSLRIYNRWGELIFQRNNFQPGDANASWDGYFKGSLVPSGAYIYILEMTCNGDRFSRKGTVTVIY